MNITKSLFGKVFLCYDFLVKQMPTKRSAIRKTVFVTGASGKIGNRLVRELLSRNYNVFALTRDKKHLSIKNSNLKIIESDISQIKNYIKFLRESDYVIHLAVYQNAYDTNRDNFQAVNVLGTKTIIEATRQSKIKKLIYLSTSMVFQVNTKKGSTEKSKLKNEPTNDLYVDTKIEALKLARRYKPEVPMIIIFPAIVIDPREIISTDNKPQGKIQGLLWNVIGGGVPGGLMAMVGNKNRLMNYIFIDNLIEAIIRAMVKAKNGKEYILGGENITVEKYINQTLKLKKAKHLPIRIPASLLKFVSWLNLPPLKTINVLANNLPPDLCLDSSSAQRDLGLKIERISDLI